MMKKNLFILFLLLFSTFCFGQKWYLNKVNKGKKYKYEYWFTLQNEKDSNLVSVKDYKLIDSQKSISGTLVDAKNESIPFATIQVFDLKQNLLKTGTSDIDGKFSIGLELGHYKLAIVAATFDKLAMDLELKEHQALSLAIKLGKGSEDEVYQINATRRLMDEEMNKIIDCVMRGRSKNAIVLTDNEISEIVGCANDYKTNGSKKKLQFQLMMHI